MTIVIYTCEKCGKRCGFLGCEKCNPEEVKKAIKEMKK